MPVSPLVSGMVDHTIRAGDAREFAKDGIRDIKNRPRSDIGCKTLRMVYRLFQQGHTFCSHPVTLFTNLIEFPLSLLVLGLLWVGLVLMFFYRKLNARYQLTTQRFITTL